MEMVITLPGGSRVDAQVGRHTVKTDQPVSAGGEGSAPAPYALFLASIGTCAGIYIVGFCRQRGIPTEGIRIIQRVYSDQASGLANQIDLEIQVPPDFPEKYHAALIRSAEQCKVKKNMEYPPRFNTFVRATEADEA